MSATPKAQVLAVGTDRYAHRWVATDQNQIFLPNESLLQEKLLALERNDARKQGIIDVICRGLSHEKVWKNTVQIPTPTYSGKNVSGVL
ncbi:hypothetical protein Trydic_g15509 [Trypoxylus dichotomus]